MHRCVFWTTEKCFCFHFISRTLNKSDVMNWFQAVSESDGKKQFNIYHDPNVSEAVLCRPVLNGLVEKVSELLLAFPKHPTLMQVCIVSHDNAWFSSMFSQNSLIIYAGTFNLFSMQPYQCFVVMVMDCTLSR